jgi:hypothetical protein
MHTNEFHADRNLKTPEQWHDRNHLGPFATCFRCGQARARCRAKIAFASWAEAEEWVEEFNTTTEYVDPLQRYHCRWCLQWHMGHPRNKAERKRLERKRRQWLIEKRTKT